MSLLAASPVHRPVRGKRRGAGHARHTPEIITELDRYLQAPCDLMVTDIVEWWFARRGEYPVLSKMALDYCSATGVLSDHIFDV